MKLPVLLARLALLAAALAAAAGLPARAERKIALVIGNAAYPTAPLRNPVNDAKAMAARLQALGYDVALHTDVAQRDFTRAVSRFGQRLAPGSVALFYYAGHGMQVRGRNFLVPVDADIQSEASARSEAVDLDLVLEQLGPTRLAMVILDACRNNPFEGRFRSSGGSGLAQVDAPKGTLLAYATAPGKVASDGEGTHGLYTAELLKAMDLPGAKVEEVFKAVRVNVIKATAGAQVPWESSSLTGDYFFRPAVAARPAAEPKQADLQAKLEAERRQREKDAAALKAEMEKLREEVRRLSVAAAPAPAPEPAPAKPSTAKPAPAKAAEPKPAPAKPAEARPAEAKRADAKPVAGSALRDAGAREWARRIASLEELRGQLSFSKAAAILLGPFTDEQLLVLVGKERALKDLPYSSAFALGVTARGTLAGGRSWGARSPQVAEEVALENCARHAAMRCQVVLVNGEFREAGFVAWARSATGKSLLQLRGDLLRLRAEVR
ncbi:MAG: caspase family protein [Burkholderiales bacterium]|nr:caspase family protein [Burkholderiales bacterium]